MGKLDFVHQRVAPNKREFAYPLLHARGYRLPGFYREVEQVCVELSDATLDDEMLKSCSHIGS